jgi:hypothetical protein
MSEKFVRADLGKIPFSPGLPYSWLKRERFEPIDDRWKSIVCLLKDGFKILVPRCGLAWLPAQLYEVTISNHAKRRRSRVALFSSRKQPMNTTCYVGPSLRDALRPPMVPF